MKTIIHIQAFNSKFSIELTRKEYVSLEYCKSFVRRNLEYSTAQIEYIVQGNKRVDNPNYKEPFELVPVISTRYLKIA